MWGATGGNLMGLSVEVNLQAQGHEVTFGLTAGGLGRGWKGLGHLQRDPIRIFHETLAIKRYTIQAPTRHS